MSPKIASFLVLLVLVIMQGADEALGESCSVRMAVLENTISALNGNCGVQVLSGIDVHCEGESGQEYVRIYEKTVNRAVKVQVTFSTPFTSVPSVTIGMSALDADHTHNLRIISKAINIQKDGFVIITSEWDDTILYMTTIDWIACSK